MTISLERDPQLNSLEHAASAPQAGGASATVALRRLDEVSRELGIDSIDLLKVDAEGHDLHVLQGAEALFKAGRVRAVLVEVDFGRSAVVHGNFAAITDWLAAHRLRFLSLHGQQALAQRNVPYFDYANALFVSEG